MRKRYFCLTIAITCILLYSVVGLSAEKQENEYNELLVSINVKDADIADVLKMIAGQSGLNIVAGKNVKGNVSITFIEIPVFNALESILEVNNYTYAVENDVIKIYTHRDKILLDESRELEMAIFSLENIKVADVEPILTTLKSHRGKIQINARLNQIIVYDLPRKVEKMQEIIVSMDSKRLAKKNYVLNCADAEKVKERTREAFLEGIADIYVDERTHSLVINAAPMFIEEIDGFITRWNKPSKKFKIEAKTIQVTSDKNSRLSIEELIISITPHIIKEDSN